MILTDHLVVPRWIMKELEFKGNQLIAYSLFYQFKGSFISVEHVSDTLAISKKGARDALGELMNKGYILQVFKDKNAYWYKINEDFIPKKYR